MHAAPVLRGGPVARSAWLVAGLFLCACGIVAFLESRLGLSPWDVLHQGIAKHTPLSFGLANVVVAIGVLFLAWRLGSRPGIGTVANAVLIGLFVALLVRLSVVQDLAGWPLLVRVALLVAGLALFGFGTALYIGAAVGAGPRDSLMLVGALRSGLRIGGARVLLEGTALVTGFLLGGTVGINTLIFALLIKPTIKASFWLVNRINLAA
jgi:uncharacterized membrane protein YczE